MSPRVGLDLKTIVITAAEIADQEGIEKVTLATLARELNVRPPSLFNHIKGLSSLKRELSLYGLTILFENLRNASAGKKKDDAIFAIAHAYYQFTQEHPGVYELTIQAPKANDDEMREKSNQILELLNEVLKEYQLTEEETIHAIRGLRSILHGFSTLQQKGAFGLPVNLLEDSYKRLIRGFILSLRQMNELTLQN